VSVAAECRFPWLLRPSSNPDEQRKHLARTLQIIVLGQLVFFGYKALESRRLSLAEISLVAYAIVDGAALYLLRGETPGGAKRRRAKESATCALKNECQRPIDLRRHAARQGADHDRTSAYLRLA